MLIVGRASYETSRKCADNNESFALRRLIFVYAAKLPFNKLINCYIMFDFHFSTSC